MTKSELIKRLAARSSLTIDGVELAVDCILKQMTQSLAKGERIEIRNFGCFTLHYRKARTARNPKTGDTVISEEKFTPHFKPGKKLRDKVNAGARKTLKN